MSNDHEFLKQAAKPKKGVLASEVASAQSDPRFYSAMKVLPNPDPILRKLGRSQDVYDAISYDSHVAGELRSQRGSLLKKKWRLQPGAPDTASIEAFELCNAIFSRRPSRNMQWSDQIYNTFRAIYRGFSVSEVLWERQGNHLVPCEVKDKPNRRFVFSNDHELRLLIKGNQSDGIELPDYKFLLSRHMPDCDNPHGFALFSACFWSYTFKHNGFRWFSRFMERYGIPAPVGTYPAGTPEDQQQQLADALFGLIEDAVAVIPEGNEVQLLEPKSGGEKPHPVFINMCNREMSKALTSQTLGSEVTEAGSRSTAEVQKDRQDDNGEADRSMVESNYQQLCDWITDFNFENAIPPVWEFYDDEETNKDVAETMEIAVRTAPVKKSEFYERMQLTPPEEGDEVIYKPTSSPVTETETDSDNDFSGIDCGHTFNQEDFDELSKLAEQGNQNAQLAVERMVDAVEQFASDIDSLDELDEALPGILDDVETEDFSEPLGDAMVVANAIGLERAKT